MSFENFLHPLGAFVIAAIILYVPALKRAATYGTRLGLALIGGILGNVLWEVAVDHYHLILNAWSANDWYIGDIKRGAIGAAAMIIIHFLFWRKDR